MAIFAEPNNITGVVQMLQYVNSVTDAGGTGGLLGVGLLIIIGAVSFLSMRGFSYEKTLSSSTFFVMIIAVFLRFLELINDGVLVFTIALFVVSLYFLHRDRSFQEI